jgi:carboxymethylenebutenolidase
MGDFIDIKTSDGTFKGYLARPDKTPAAVIVVIQEIFGINRVMTGIADEFAAQGSAG